MTRIGNWLRKVGLLASDEDSVYFEFWDRVIDHEPLCRCAFKGQVIADMLAICERHPWARVASQCAHHAHTYEQVGQ